MQDLDAPRLKKSLPHYLTLDESIQLLEVVDETNRERDYCILGPSFSTAELRISELVSFNITDIRGEQLRVLGKGNKGTGYFPQRGLPQAIGRLAGGAQPPGGGGSETPCFSPAGTPA